MDGRHDRFKEDDDPGSPTATLIAYLESLQMEYNQLSSRLMAQTCPKAGVTYQPIHSSTPQAPPPDPDYTPESLTKRVKFLTQQLKVTCQDKATLEKTLQQQQQENNSKISKLKVEVQGWKDDVVVLKDILKRLNEQLNRYHLKHGKTPDEKFQNITKLSEQDISRSSIHKLSAVLMAYDELLQERDATIKNSAGKLDNLMVRVEAVTSENEDLHTRLERLQTQVPLGAEESDLVASDARLLLEERELLLQEVQALRRQKQQQALDNQHQVRRLREELEESEAVSRAARAEADEWKQDYKKLEEECTDLHTQLHDSIPREEHQQAVQECHRLFDDLRRAYNESSGTLKTKATAATQEKHTLAHKLTDTHTHAHALTLQVSGLKGSLRKSESKMHKRDRSLKALQSATRLAQSRLKSLTQVCSELLEDREKLLAAFVAQRNETEELSKEVTLRSAAVGALSQKLKEERLAWSERVSESEGAMKAAQTAWQHCTHEIQQLRSLVSSKDNTITTLIADYK
ncbi:hypothetical protein Pmani_035096 [Petrolisthes manimaculis]|nr:hypothetical protein Pmani_035096 [Petrolisthes manimaculis]